MPNIRRFMDLSTRHLDGEARDFLEATGDGEHLTPMLSRDTWPAIRTPTGFFVYAWEADQLPTVRVPHSLGIIMVHARRHGCDYLMFDQDGPDDPELELFEPEDGG